MIKRSYLLASILLTFSALTAFGQSTTNLTRTEKSTAEIDKIIHKFMENERAFRAALTNYNFNRSATVHTLGMGGQITGTFRRDSQMALTPSGERIEKIVFAPVSTVPLGTITPEDLEDLGGVNPFALEPSAFDQYNFAFIGEERIDELDLYVFEVTPKVIPDYRKSKLRLFTGRIWVDKEDLMIVKTKGKGVPEWKDNKFPVVETWRENVDGKYWFPSFASADEELIFENGSSLKIRMKVKFTNYAVGHTDVQIIEDDAVIEPTPAPAPAPSATPKKPE